MKHLLSAEGQTALSNLVRASTLFVFDFDGTLAPIVNVPEDAHMDYAVASQFKKLCMLAPVVILTGRAVKDVEHRLDAKPLYIIGNHGAEGLPSVDDKKRLTMAKICTLWIDQLRDIFRVQEIIPGVRVEYKHYSICLHYRETADAAQAREHLELLLQKITPSPICINGKYVINLLPSDAPNKSDALNKLIEITGASSCFFIGDDETDEWVFRNALPNWVTAKVGPGITSAAQFYLPHQTYIKECLDMLLHLLQRSKVM